MFHKVGTAGRIKVWVCADDRAWCEAQISPAGNKSIPFVLRKAAQKLDYGSKSIDAHL